MTLLRRGRLFWNTVRYLRPQQVVSRARLKTQAIGRRTFPESAWRRYRRRASRLALHGPAERWTTAREQVAQLAAPDALQHTRRAADGAVDGNFSFLNVDLKLGSPIGWCPDEASQLWIYHLQYSGFLADIAATRPQAWPVISTLMRQWIAANPLGRARDAWHPFVVSERVVNWMVAALMTAPAGQPIDGDILESVAIQTVLIDRNLETDVGGNHLLKNLKAMVFAGCFWSGSAADAWRERYVAWFDRELAAQVLSDGAHYERTPMYHLLVLCDALEALAMLRAFGHAAPSTLVTTVRDMLAYIPAMTHPDGGIALFNDSVFEEAPPPAAVSAFARWVVDDVPPLDLTVRHAAFAAAASRPLKVTPVSPRPRATEDGGLVRLDCRGGRDLLIADMGRACPDDLPAHAHADLFSFEASVDGSRLIVDSGVGEYRAGPWREYYRSTRAHNTVAIDGVDQIECWGSFRVARRARIHDRATVDGPRLKGVSARHDGYARLDSPVDVARTLATVDGAAWLIVDDISGPGAHHWSSFLHFSPDATVTESGDRSFDVVAGDARAAVWWFGALELSMVRGAREPVQGWYAPEFGRHVPNDVAILQGSGRLPAMFGWLIVPGCAAAECEIDVQDADTILMSIRGAAYRVSGRRSQLRLQPLAPAPA